MKRVLILLMLILLIIPLSFAKTEYPNIGGVDGDYNNGEGFFGDAVQSLTIGIGVTPNTQVPLVVDLDGDGITEIVIIDGSTIRILNSTLSVKDTLSLGLTGTISNMITFDIDGDGREEMIVAGEDTELIKVADWNGTDLILQSELNYSNTQYHHNPDIFGVDGGQIQIACDSVQSCQLHISSTRKRGNPNKGNLSVVLFNESQIHNFTSIIQNPINFETYCAPNVKNVEVVDIDADGEKDYISSWLEQSSTDGRSIIIAVDTNGVLKSGFPIIDSDTVTSGANDCEDGIGRVVSPPTVFPAFGGVEGSAESQIIIATMISATAFKIKAYDASGVEIDDFPEVTSGDSNLISTVVRGNFFPDTQDVDFCAMGYDTSPQELDLVCGSLLSGEFPDTNSYRINISEKFIIDQNLFENWDVIAHSTNHENTQSLCLDVSCSANDLDEILTPYGIFRLEREGFLCDGFGVCKLKEVFANPFNTSGVFVSVDTTGAGAEDLFLMTDTNLFLFDALFQDQPAEIDRSSISINPCIDSAWQINTTAIISFKVDDTDPVGASDLDQVFGQVFLYADSTNEQRSVAQGASASGTTFFFDQSTFNINRTTGSGIIRLIGNDTGGTEQDIVNIPFTVAETGLTLGECVTEGFGVVVEDVFISDPDLTTDASDDAITTGILSLGGISGLAGTTIWLILMIAFAIGIFFRASDIGWSGNSALGAIAIVETLFIILGARLGILSTSLVVIIVVIAVVILGVFLGRFLTGSGAGANN